jgi:two-component system cell cycle sensor histidine kinase/response regulator CckA
MLTNAQALYQSSGSPSGGETVLLVDDEHALRRLTRRVLENSGYAVVEACDGIDALNVCASHEGLIDVLVTDVVMPGLGGPSLAEQISALYPQVKVLFVSGYTDDAVARHGIVRDEMAYLPKPFTPAALAEKIRQVLDG